uniref:Uncharacterized protein n=1 Tax=Rhipicephalus appendiculatus TaxID=34631 RepID=A0A131YEF2_RHIAP
MCTTGRALRTLTYSAQNTKKQKNGDDDGYVQVRTMKHVICAYNISAFLGAVVELSMGCMCNQRAFFFVCKMQSAQFLHLLHVCTFR